MMAAIKVKIIVGRYYLPKEIGNPVVYIVTGTLPIIATLNQRRLTLFAQMAIKNEASKTWITSVRHLLAKYDQPTVYELIDSTPSRYGWKKLLKQNVINH